MRRDAGTVLRAGEALLGEQETFTREQVAYLIDLAFESGLRFRAAYAEGEMLASWARHHGAPPTRAERIAAELAAVDRAARLRAEREGRPYRVYRGGPVDWETGAPVRQLGAVA
ncbi:hypothetical protein Aph02nite_50230 [Actinoplanes philippinensis]|uniref:Uncharacterized protein n=1 Tax=Actinoplanes philippinensis TaxID=35752 RepID=A0A1I2IUM1_9ACTN|nr:hypothetical protein [Actinoplanes philippinensis]GIE79073.1 hypothetical protein Aph02nite_50230 [Actinoplanes philippinensis]SFF44456.1 hypothetical protein SAMN05421541_110339 [Actinoplanes philippinensis]